MFSPLPVTAQPKIQVFVLTHNRPTLVRDAVRSILEQQADDFAVVVSDNSTADDTETIFAGMSHPRLRYVRRAPGLPQIQHFSTVSEEVRSPYFMMFHDDDLMLPNCIRTLSDYLDRHTGVAAVGCNAYFIENDRLTTHLCFDKTTSGDVVFRDVNEFVRHYLDWGPVAVFPSYMYRWQAVQNIALEAAPGGKYRDVSYLMQIAGRGAIAWLAAPLLGYRIHHGQDTRTHVLHDRLKLLRYIYKTTRFGRASGEARKFRYISWCIWLTSLPAQERIRHPRRVRTVFWCLLPYRLRARVESLLPRPQKIRWSTASVRATGTSLAPFPE